MSRVVQGFCVIDRETGARWGGMYESVRGATASFDKARGPIIMHPTLGRRMYWAEQDRFVITPLYTNEEDWI